MTIEERGFASLEQAAVALADGLAGALRIAIAARRQALLVVSGGHTPPLVFRHLRGRDVDWARVTVTLSDERWVPVDHPDSNERLIRSFLLSGSAAGATFVPLYGGENGPVAGQAACEARLAAMARPFDAVYLGFGRDGHFASLFPGDPALEARGRLCVAVAATASRGPRLTLTVPAILEARKLFLLFAGGEKHAIYAQAKRPGPVGEVPLRLVLRQERVPVSVLSAP